MSLPREHSSLAAVLALAVVPNIGFGAQRQIEVEGQHQSDAVAIIGVTVGSMDVECGLVASPPALQPVTPFEAGDDWLQNTTLYLFNRTNKTIAFGQIGIWFPQTGDGSPERPMSVYNLTLGRLPDNAAYSGRTGRPLSQPASAQPIVFAPGQTLAVRLSDYANQIQGSVSSMPISSVTRVKIRRSSFVFEDGMRWDGDYATPDTAYPGRWKRLGANYFPGDRHRYWPPPTMTRATRM